MARLVAYLREVFRRPSKGHRPTAPRWRGFKDSYGRTFPGILERDCEAGELLPPARPREARWLDRRRDRGRPGES